MFNTYIDINDLAVRSFLEEMARGTPSKQSNPLLDLWLVSGYIIRHQMPDTSHFRQFALQTILADTITNQCNRHLALYHLPQLNLEETYNSVPKTMLTNIQTDNQELICWIWLYYRYVRVDLDFSTDHLAEVTGGAARTIRRQIERGVHRLTLNLIEQECVMREQFHQHRLRTALPHPPSPHFIGRNDDLHTLKSLLIEESNSPNHIMVTGSSGIGKTTLVREVTSALIQTDSIDAVTWIDEPHSLEDICHQVLPYNSTLSIDAYTMVCKLIVVVDSIKWLEYTEIIHLLKQLSYATVILIDDSYPKSLHNVKYYSVGSLNSDDAKKLIQLYSNAHFTRIGWSLDEQEIASIQIGTDRNPRNIVNAVHQYWGKNKGDLNRDGS